MSQRKKATARPSSSALSPLFAFESEYQRDLRCIPMVISFWLDLSGIQIKPEAWEKIPLSQRKQLLVVPWSMFFDVSGFKDRISKLVDKYGGPKPDFVCAVPPTEWSRDLGIPGKIRKKLDERGVPMRSDKWALLSEGQRYALYKLLNSARAPEFLGRALVEFGVT